MSKRIRELARDAGIKMIHDETLALGYLDTAHKKFAELIIKETMLVVAKNVAWNGYLNAADAVIAHFGVDE